MIGLLLALACGLPDNPSRGEPHAAFPHPADYAEDGAHTADAADPAACWSCHTRATGALLRGAAPTTPACNDCHAHPHAPAYGAGATHGADWRAERELCTSCHGETGRKAPGQGDAGICVGCHATYPHTETWEEAAAHGTAVRVRAGVQACSGCHDDPDRVPPEALCTECHDTYPHPEGWAEPQGHGAAWTPDTCETTCHANTGAPGDLTCASCHDLFPHAADFRGVHLQRAQERGDGACSGCHTTALPGSPVLPVSCNAICHEAP